MTRDHFAHVTTWVFDLDDTLYPAHVRLLERVRDKMTAFMQRELSVSRAEADALRAQYWRDHGTTLAGLMQHHEVEPWPFLREVHDVPLHGLEPDPDLAEVITALPGRAIVYTNGDAEYAGRVLEARGLTGIFNGIFGVEHGDWRPKPERAAFDTVFAKAEVATKTAAMFDDDPRNLAVPHDLGMQTVHVAPEPASAPHVGHHTANLTEFLREIL